MKKIILLIFILHSSLFTLHLKAQVGDYRNVWAVGVNGGYAMNTVRFMPEVPQNTHGGMTLGVTGRYTSEKYFSTICSIQAEVNLTQLGWKQQIETVDGAPVINPETEVAEEYKRDITYVEIPIFAHLAWGKEKHGINAFINAGPQIGFIISDKTTKNYEVPFTSSNFPMQWTSATGRVNSEVAQETMAIENKVDYGIAAGGGVEWDIKNVGRFSLEGRYYYGLGNLYGDSKKDEFGRSPNATITVKLTYLRDL